MTAVNCFISPDLVVVATDTPVTDTSTWRPTFHMPKVEAMPHIGCLLSCKGIGRLIPDVCGGLVLDRTRGLDDAVPVALAVCRQSYAAVIPLLPQLTLQQRELLVDGAFFLFGWSERQGRLTGYRFPVRHGFEAQHLSDGCHAHPALEVVPFAVAADRLDGLVEMVRAQERSSQQRPGSQRDHIVGHVVLWTIQQVGQSPKFTAEKVFLFEDA